MFKSSFQKDESQGGLIYEVKPGRKKSSLCLKYRPNLIVSNLMGATQF